jgi:hypothetical protein
MIDSSLGFSLPNIRFRKEFSTKPNDITIPLVKVKTVL